MKYLLLIFITIAFISCSGSDESRDSDSTNLEEEPDMNDFILDDMINCESPDSIIASYSRIRRLTAGDGNFEIRGNTVWEDDGFWIINIEEEWEGNYWYPLVIVIGASNQLEGADEEHMDGQYPDMLQFISERMICNYQVLQGKFENIDYDNYGYKGIVLNQVNNFRTEWDGQKRLFLINKLRLEPTHLIARTRCLIGECEDMDGFMEEIKIAPNGDVYIERTENHLGECLLQMPVQYDKIWKTTDHMLKEDFPRFFKFIFPESDAFQAIPKEFYNLNISGNDTIQSFDKMRIDVHTMDGNPQFADLEYIGLHDFMESLIIYFNFNGDDFELYTRSSGTLWSGGENYGNAELLTESEDKMQFSRLIFTQSALDPEVYICLTGETETFWTTRNGKFPLEEIDEEY